MRGAEQLWKRQFEGHGYCRAEIFRSGNSPPLQKGEESPIKCNLTRAGGGGETTARRSEGRRQSTHEGEAAAFASSFFAVIASFRSKSSH
jgi:hypothetical protein